MIDLNKAIERIKLGDKMYVGYFENNIIGYSWLKPINNYQYYIYNVFIEQDTTNRNFGASDLVYLIIKYHTKGLITLDVDEWNRKAQKFAEKLGFTKILIHNYNQMLNNDEQYKIYSVLQTGVKQIKKSII